MVTPKLVAAGWGNAPHVIGEQRTLANGRIIVTGGRVRRGKQKRADYLLYYRRDYPLAKTIVFCVDQEHAAEMCQELVNLKAIWSSNTRLRLPPHR